MVRADAERLAKLGRDETELTLKEVRGQFMHALKHQEKLVQANKNKIVAGRAGMTEVETLHARKERNAEIHMETVGDKLDNKLERNIRNIKNSVDLSRIKLLEKIARLEIFFKDGISQACLEVKEQLREDIQSEERR